MLVKVNLTNKLRLYLTPILLQYIMLIKLAFALEHITSLQRIQSLFFLHCYYRFTISRIEINVISKFNAMLPFQSKFNLLIPAQSRVAFENQKPVIVKEKTGQAWRGWEFQVKEKLAWLQRQFTGFKYVVMIQTGHPLSTILGLSWFYITISLAGSVHNVKCYLDYQSEKQDHERQIWILHCISY